MGNNPKSPPFINPIKPQINRPKKPTQKENETQYNSMIYYFKDFK